MNETEYVAPNGTRWMVSEVTGPFEVPNANGTPNSLPMHTLTCRRWIKSRKAFAKVSNQLGTRCWEQWTKAVTPKEDHTDHGHLNQYDEDTCEALGRALEI